MAIRQKLKRWNRLAIAGVLLFVLVLPLLSQQKSEAYTLPLDREIRLSSSANGSYVETDANLLQQDGVDVIYSVRFQANQDGNSVDLRSMVLEFCDNTPILGATCTAPLGFDLNATTGDTNLALFNQQNTGANPWTIDTTYSTVNRLVLTRAAGASIASGTVLGFDLGDGGNNGVDNPETTNTTFYARVATFDTVTGAQEYQSDDIENLDDIPNLDAGAANTVIDAGGFAMSTAAQITVTAKVPEKLTFCVYTADGTPAHTCGRDTPVVGTSITLGDENGILSELEEFVNTEAKYTISTNATDGVSIQMTGGTLKNTTTCSEAPGQNCSIDSIDPTLTGGTFGSNPGSEQFGLCTYLDPTTDGSLAPVARYAGGVPGCDVAVDNSGDPANGTAGDADNLAEFAFYNSAVDGTVSTYGDTIATKTPGDYSTGVLAFIGNISVVTEPGIYTSTFTFIATGTY